MGQKNPEYADLGGDHLQQFGSLGGWDVGRLSMLDSLGIEVSHSLNCLSTQTYHDQLPCAHIAPRPLPSISDHHSPPQLDSVLYLGCMAVAGPCY